MTRRPDDGKARYLVVFALVAMFILGSVTTLITTAGGPGSCDWEKSTRHDIFTENANGAATPEDASKDVMRHEEELQVPLAAVTSQTGEDYYKVAAVTDEGHVAYNVYIDNVPRVEAEVLKFEDGTHALSGFRTCFGV